MQELSDGKRAEAVPCEQEVTNEYSCAERRYKHVHKSNDCSKLRHNQWVLRSALARQAQCLVLDGVNILTSKTLIGGGIPAWRIHVPNKADYDAIVALSHPLHGNIYRCSVLQWLQALASLGPSDAPESISPIIPSCASEALGIKTIWLDFTCRWSSHVEQALALTLRASTMGIGSGDLFLTLNADRRCPSTLRCDDAKRFIAAAVERADGTVDFPPDHCEEYGNGMFILHAIVSWSSGFSAVGENLYDRLRCEAHAFRKCENSVKAKAD